MGDAPETSARLAIDGGAPVRATLLPYARQSVTEEDIAAVDEVLRSDWLTTGPAGEGFEESFAERTGARHAVSFSSGTAALHAAVRAAGIGAGDEVVTTPLSFAASANAAVYEGATPVFADVEVDTLCLDPAAAAKRVGPRTRGIVVVDYAGHPGEIDALLELAEDRDLVVIEDGCHAIGALFRGRRVGALSHLTTFSFHPVKHITTGEGGMVTTDSDDLAERLRRFRNHGITRDARERNRAGTWEYDVEEIGINGRLSDIAAALGHSQLGRLDAELARRRSIVETYDAALGELAGVTPPAERPHVRSAWHLYPIRLDPDALRADRDAVFAALRAENIGVNVHYRLISDFTAYRERFGTRPEDTPRALAAYRSLITLPLFGAMSDDDVSDVIEAVRKVVRHYGR